MGDTAWALSFVTTREEVTAYLDARRRQCFNTVLIVGSYLAGCVGCVGRTQAAANRYGHEPFSSAADPLSVLTRPRNDDDYWDHIHFIIKEARKRHMYVGFVPFWGRTAVERNGYVTTGNAHAFGQKMAEMFGTRQNLLWLVGGDASAKGTAGVYRGFAQGLRDGGALQLITFHPVPHPMGSAAWFAHDAWIDFHTFQSSHAALDQANYQEMASLYRLDPPKPALDGEPRYEDHAINWNPANGYFRAFDVRQAAYWSVFAGAFGHVYGHVSVWQMREDAGRADAPIAYRDALAREGGEDMQHLVRLMTALPLFGRVPDQSLIASGQRSDGGHLRATRGGDYALVYAPFGSPFAIDMGRISGATVTADWYDPRDGSVRRIGTLANTGTRQFDPPGEAGRGNDWVLMLVDSSRSYAIARQM